MKIVQVSKIINSIGLAFDIVGAWYLYKFAFELPRKLQAQTPIPSSQKEYVKNGIPTKEISMGVQINLRNFGINRYNEYKDFLYKRRALFGFGCLAAGFFLQIVSNFVTIKYLPIACGLAGIISIFLLSFWCFLFVYFRNIQTLSDGAGNTIKFRDEGKGAFGIDSDPEYQTWVSKVEKYRKKAGLK